MKSNRHQRRFNSLQVVQVPQTNQESGTFRLVSIPYRQSRYQYCFHSFFCLAMFQFLIGSLGTRKGVDKRKSKKLFQFLIGSLGTLSPFIKIEPETRFNSLQVVQVRQPCLFCSVFHVLVSIPYRQSRYLKRSMKKLWLMLVSIPYRQSRYDSRKQRIEKVAGVSIPYRQSRYLLSPTYLNYIIQFQFLIGSLGTEVKLYLHQPKNLCFNSLQVVQVRLIKGIPEGHLHSFNSLQVVQVLKGQGYE